LLDPKLHTLSINYVPNLRQFPSPKIAALNATQPHAWTLASLTLAPAKNGGKLHHFGIYLIRGLFDTPENRVVTSGLTFASLLEAFLGIQSNKRSPKPSQKWTLLKSPGKSIWNFVLEFKENDG